MSANFLAVTLYAKKGQMEHELANAKTRIESLSSLDQVGGAYMAFEADKVLETIDKEDKSAQLEAIRQDLLNAWETCYNCYTDPGQDGTTLEIGEYEVLLSAGITWGDPPTETYSAIVKLDYASVFNYPSNGA